MTEDATAVIVDEYVRWVDRKPAGLLGNEDDALELLWLTTYVVDEPGELRAGDLDELLLRVYPSEMVVHDRDQVTGVVPSARDLLVFLGDTGRLEPAVSTRLSAELDEIEPVFLDAVMDPARWGPKRQILQAMTEEQLADLDDDLDDDLDLAEALGLPEHLPALRLPPEPALAVAARESEPLRRAAALAQWVGERRTVTEDDGDLTPDDAVAAARSLGIDVPERPVRAMADLPELLHLWHLAFATGLVEYRDDGDVGATAESWPTGGDDDDLGTWATAFGQTLTGLELDAELAGRDDLDFSGFGALALMLFLARNDGLSLAELTELAQEAATEELPPAEAATAWDSWTTAHGDPASALLARLVAHGAAELDDDTARLTPLGLWAMRDQLGAAGVTVPLLPPVAEMTAADLLDAADGFTEDELETETEQWLALRDPATAVDELLDAAATAHPAERLLATEVVARLGAAAEPRWRAALEQPELRSYAKIALNRLAGPAAPEFGPGLEPLPEDLAWLLTDLLAATSDAFEDDELAQQFRSAVPPGQEQAVLDAMWRLPHPDGADVLSLLGDTHPDKKIAKAARKAAFKAQSRSSDPHE
ncbi:MAG TPA: hypothetical protein VHH15_13695 [Actinophytocola sp.]|nr:hypothetical protein [Actinophytocola sp.]